MFYICFVSYHKGVKNSPLKYEIAARDKVMVQVNLLNIGNAQALTILCEALPNIGFHLKRPMVTRMPFLFSLTNDAFGYILTKEDFGRFK